MPRRDAERLKQYLAMVTRKHGGLEAQIEELRRDNSFESARGGLESMARGRAPSDAELNGLEAIIDEKLRPVFLIADGKFRADHPLWRRLSDDATIRARIEAVIPSVGRIELPGNPQYPYGGTGFIVGNGLVMTNRHVAEIFAKGLGDRALRFVNGRKAGVDFLREQDRPTGPTFMVRKVVMIHPYWDMALLAVDGIPDTRVPLRLSLKDSRDLVGHDIFIVGYPAFDGRNPTDVQQDLFNGRFGVKRLQPGELQGGMKTASFGKMVRSATHDVSTLGGNSGAGVIDLDTGEVLGLHFGGSYHEQNFCVPASELARDSRVVDAGVMFAGNPPGGANEWGAWWRRADSNESRYDASADARPAVATSGHPMPSGQASAAVSTAGGAMTIDIPLRITVSLGAPASAVAAAGTEAVAALGLEGLVEPWRDTDYSSRTGYNPDFLNEDNEASPISVPMPKAAKPGDLAMTRTGDDVLHYQNFSISMHAKRRLALITASNVTNAQELRQPDGKKYTRKELSGLGKNDQERWFLDPRLDAKFQIPDVFFTKDRKAFDKGHIVRRDDVAWGKSFDELRRGNGDSYHVTNCSPQVKDYNQSAQGEDNWGDLENHVLSEAANERLCVFAGPVLDPSDEVFVGVGDDRTTLRAKIPSRFWKVIVARVSDGIAAFGFVLEQDLADVQWEFAVPEEFVKSIYPIGEIEAMTGVMFDQAIRDADQYETARGAEVGMRAGARRSRRRS